MNAVDRWIPQARAAIARWSSLAGVTIPLQVVLAMIRVESRGNPAALRREPDGRISRGLMQVLEGTARDLGLQDPRRLHEPAIGIDVGVHYLAQQLGRYGGNLTRAVAAYNAGSARYRQDESFVNQGYVNRVAAAMRSLASSPAAWGGGVLVLGSLAFLAIAARRGRRKAAA